MRIQKIIIFLFIFVAVSPAIILAQRELKGEVMTKLSNEKIESHPGVAVRIKYHGIERNTNDDGEFRLPLKDELIPGTPITLAVDKPGFAIYRPYNGQWNLSNDFTVTIEILPLGHPLFKTPDEIEKWADDVREQAKKQLGTGDEPEKLNLGRYIKEWALQYGFNPEQAREEINAWIKEVEKNKDPNKRAKAEFLNNNFALADSLFGESVSWRRQKREQLMKQVAEETRQLTLEIIQDLRAQGDSRYQDYRFAEALKSYEQALAETNPESFPWLWAAVQNDLSLANRQLGIRVHGDALAIHLHRAIQGYENALKVYTRETYPQQWAMTQNNLGNALKNQGIRTGGEPGAQLLAEAVAAYRLALEVYTREQLPQQWVMTQNNLGTALSDQGIRTGRRAGRPIVG